MTDSSGTVVWAADYKPFGEAAITVSTITNNLRFPGQYFDTETGLHYNYYRDYSPIIGRYIEADPINDVSNQMISLVSEEESGFDDSSPYAYTVSNPSTLIDPLGLYSVKGGVPAPSPQLHKLLTCMDRCMIGLSSILVTSTTNGKHQDRGHAAGTSVDIRPPSGSALSVFCCAGRCGAAYGLNEGKGGIKTKYTKGYNYHIQLVPRNSPSPKAPNAIPPTCNSFSCSTMFVFM
jgi:RHS repeat-associated protein